MKWYLLSLTFFLAILLTSPASANIVGDDSSILPCGGDDQTTFVCGFGDDENAFYNFIPTPTAFEGAEIPPEEREAKISKAKVIISSGIFLFILFIILLLIFLKKRND